MCFYRLFILFVQVCKLIKTLMLTKQLNFHKNMDLCCKWTLRRFAYSENVNRLTSQPKRRSEPKRLGEPRSGSKIVQQLTSKWAEITIDLLPEINGVGRKLLVQVEILKLQLCLVKGINVIFTESMLYFVILQQVYFCDFSRRSDFFIHVIRSSCYFKISCFQIKAPRKKCFYKGISKKKQQKNP